MDASLSRHRVVVNNFRFGGGEYIKILGRSLAVGGGSSHVAS